MTTRRWAAVAVVALATGAVGTITVLGQTPRDTRIAPAAAAPKGPTGTAVVSGVVSAADGGRPLRLAHVVLIGATTGVARVTETDADGRFSFSGLPADRYVVGASKPPFLGAVAGSRRAGRPGTPIAVADGQKVTTVAVRLPMGAAIGGTIVDERGQPTRATVLLQQWKIQGGDRVLANVANGTTAADEQGHYRVFGLTPGEYIVAAIGQTPAFGRVLTTDEVDAALRAGGGAASAAAPAAAARPAASSALAPIYFPGSPRTADAVPVAVAAGEERQGVDFRVEAVPVGKIDATVIGTDGQPLAGAMLMIASTGGVIQRAIGIRVGPDGRFSASGLAPGAYTVTTMQAAMPGGGKPPAPSYSTFEIDRGDQLGLQLTMKPVLTVPGHVAFQGAAAPPTVTGRRLGLSSLSVGGTGGVTLVPQATPVAADGSFSLNNVWPGKYAINAAQFFGASTDAVTWSLQSIAVDGKDVTDLPIDVAADAPPKAIVVTFGDTWQSVSGRLLQATGAPATDYTVVVFPSDRAYWLPNSRRILTARPGTDGRFTFGGKGPTSLPAGQYLLAAVTDLDRDEQFDPAFLGSLVASAVPVTLAPGEKKTQELRLPGGGG